MGNSSPLVRFFIVLPSGKTLAIDIYIHSDAPLQIIDIIVVNAGKLGSLPFQKDVILVVMNQHPGRGTLTSQEMDLVIQMDVSVMQPAGNLIPPEIAINVVET